MGPRQTESKDGKKYILVVAYDFSRYSFMFFLIEKYETIEQWKILWTRIHVEKRHPIVRIRNDWEREFDIVEIDHFYDFKEIKHEMPLELPNKMECLRERTMSFRKSLEWYSTLMTFQSIFGPKPLTQLVILLIGKKNHDYSYNRKNWLFLTSYRKSLEDKIILY